MKRKIVHIDEEKCNGCGACVSACHEGAIQMVDGKARLVSDSYCDGLGACLPECPMGAIRLEEREAEPFDEVAVQKRMQAAKMPLACGCPGTQARMIPKAPETATAVSDAPRPSRLAQWPCQIKLVPTNAPYLEGCKLLIAASCSAFACADVHERFIKDRITLIGCPKLDGVDYSEKLAQILSQNEIRSVTVLRMSVPCCGGLVQAVQKAIALSGKDVPFSIAVIDTNGEIL